MNENHNLWEFVQLLVGIVLIGSFYYFVFHVIYRRTQLAKLKGDDLKYFELRKVRKQLEKGEKLKSETLTKFAKKINLRFLLFELLHEYKKQDLFPENYKNQEKLAESYLANWLDMHEEFDQFPDSIRSSTQINLKNNISVEVLEFKVHNPYEWAQKGWVFAYVLFQKPSLKPICIHSDFSNEVLFEIELTQKLESIVANEAKLK